MRTRIGSIAVATGAVILLSAAPVLARTTVPIKDVAFKKASVTVNKGEVVVWRDMDRFTKHSVTSKGKPRFASSRLLDDGDTYRVRFKQRGEYGYVCRVHPSSMTGRIVVE